MPHRILCIDDDAQVLNYLVEYLAKRLGYEVATAQNGHDALQLAVGKPFDLCIIDVNLPDVTGPEIYLRLKNQMPDAEAIFFTAVVDFDKTQEFLRFSLPPERVLTKPMKDPKALTQLIIGILGPPKM